MATLDEMSSQHWKEKLWSQDQSRADGHQFLIEAQRAGFLEGKMGLRESIAASNLPPVRPIAPTPAAP